MFVLVTINQLGGYFQKAAGLSSTEMALDLANTLHSAAEAFAVTIREDIQQVTCKAFEINPQDVPNAQLVLELSEETLVVAGQGTNALASVLDRLSDSLCRELNLVRGSVEIQTYRRPA